jgi:hypothetical protein
VYVRSCRGEVRKAFFVCERRRITWIRDVRAAYQREEMAEQYFPFRYPT